MRALVSVVATVATVIHLTFGCCLHAAHFGPAASCHDCGGHAGDADACCGEHEHESATVEAADDASLRGELAVSAASVNDDHDCGGCTCAAATEDIAIARWVPAAAAMACECTTVAVPPRGAAAGHFRDRGGASPPRDAHPLHERLLV